MGDSEKPRRDKTLLLTEPPMAMCEGLLQTIDSGLI
jgi:hypothetical protein